MVAVITAGGKGTRLAAVDSGTPKPMLPVAGKPVLQHQIECLERQGVTDIILTIGHLGSQIRDFFQDGRRFGVKIEYIEEDVPLGTAGALYDLKGRLAEDFFLINGDLIFDVNLRRFMAFHQERRAIATLFAHPNDHSYDSGLIVADTDGCVQAWLTKEDERTWYQNCVNAGIHVISPRMLLKLEQKKKTDLDRDLLKPLIPSGGVYAYRSPEYVKDMGTPDRMREVECDVKSGLVQRKNLGQKQRAVFLDRDGTINQYAGFLRKAEEFVLVDGAAEAIRRFNQSGYLVLVATNQPVIARGEVTWDELHEIHRKMETLLGRKGAYVDKIFICPHHPKKGFLGERTEYKIDCACRKPKPGLLLQAAAEYNLDLAASWMIGDSDRDIQAGRNAGCQTILVSGAFTLFAAAERILGTEHS